MLSILVPVFNHDLRDLVNALYTQAKSLDIRFEILVLDDASDKRYAGVNSTVEAGEGLRYLYEEKNLGRSVARNKLASLARYDYLLFIDGDAAVTSDEFLAGYLPYCGKERVVCGGTAYTPEPPEDRDLFFRWKYGRSRESLPARKRNRHPHAGFSGFNFMIEKELFHELGFNDELVRYGHEDTLFGYELLVRGIRVRHIDNSLVHLGLEGRKKFIEKTREGLLNLHRLVLHLEETAGFTRQVRLLNLFYRLKKWRLLPLPASFQRLMETKLRKQLAGTNPGLLIFDLYKLVTFSSIYFHGKTGNPA